MNENFFEYFFGVSDSQTFSKNEKKYEFSERQVI